MSRQQAIQHYARILRRWPVDRLRPEPKQQFQQLLKDRIQKPLAAADDGAESSEINAAYLLLDNKFRNRYPLSSELMAPESDPTIYSNLAKELDELPDRTWWSNALKRMQSIVRWK